MKVINIIHALCALLISSCCAVAIQPSTFGGVVDGFGRLTNTIKVNKYFTRDAATLLWTDQIAQALLCRATA